jgi:two-component system invasion response regulator UvrY
MPTIKIAYAEDYRLLRETIIEFINSFKECEVVSDAENGLELIEKIKRLNAPPDVCILDISMPILNGYDTIIKLKELYPAMRFLILSMYDTQYNVIRMIKNGANGFLQKNCRSQDLWQAILDIYSNEYHYSAVASERTFNAVKKNRLPELTEREFRFLSLCSSELSFSQIAEIMNVGIRTLDDYETKVCQKLNVHGRNGISLFAVHNGLVPLNSHSKDTA